MVLGKYYLLCSAVLGPAGRCAIDGLAEIGSASLSSPSSLIDLDPPSNAFDSGELKRGVG